MSKDTPRPAGDVIDQFADGYYELDRNFCYRRVNPAGARLAQYAIGDMLGRSVFDLFADPELEAAQQAIRRAMAGGPAEHIETYYEPFHTWTVNSIYPLADGVAMVTRDVTAQKQLEQNLAFLAQASKVLSSSLDYRQTLQTVTELAVPRIADWCAVDMLDAAGSVNLLALSHVNPEKIRWARDLRERTPVDLSAPTGVPNVLRTGRSEFYPVITDEMLVAAAKDDASLTLVRSVGFSSVMIVPLVLDEQAIGAITFVAAESGRHFTPADLSMAEELASRAVLAIQNARLYSSSLQAVALRDDFIAVASHELKTPVTSLKLFAEVLQRQADRRGDDSTSRSLARMNEQINRLIVLIGDLLDVSRAETGRLTHDTASLDLSELIAEVVGRLQPTADRHAIEIEGETPVSIMGDRERLGQVFTNLIANAIKYSPDADRVVVRMSGDTSTVTVEVEDAGVGIAPDEQARIFDRFYRASSRQERTFPGLGIGLYITSQIVQRHGGSIEVESVPDRGSIFRVSLPAHHGELPLHVVGEPGEGSE